MKLIHLLLADGKRAVFSLRFLLSALGVTAMCFIAISGLLKESSYSIWYLLYQAIGGSGISMMSFLILPLFAFSLSYATETNQHADRYFVIRAGTKVYAFSKIVISAISGFLTIFIGMLLFVLLLLPFREIYNISIDGGAYEMLLENGRYFSGLGLFFTHYSLSGMLAAVGGLLAASFLPNRFSTIAAPFVVFFALTRITHDLFIQNLNSLNNTGASLFPMFLLPSYWVESIYSAATAGMTILIKLLTVLTLCSIMGYIIHENMERRLLRG